VHLFVQLRLRACVRACVCVFARVGVCVCVYVCLCCCQPQVRIAGAEFVYRLGQRSGAQVVWNGNLCEKPL